MPTLLRKSADMDRTTHIRSREISKKQNGMNIGHMYRGYHEKSGMVGIGRKQQEQTGEVNIHMKVILWKNYPKKWETFSDKTFLYFKRNDRSYGYQ